MILTVLQYNIQFMFKYIFDLDNKKRSVLIADFIGLNYPDIDVIVFCEAFEEESRNRLKFNLYSYGFKYSSAVLDDTNNYCFNGGVFIISKYPILYTNYYIYENSSGFDSLTNKGIVKAVFKKENKIVHVFGTHLQAWEKHRDVRNKQLLELYKYINRFNIPNDNIVVISGDFNTNSKEITKYTNYSLFEPKIISSQIYTSDPLNNSFVGLDGANTINDCEKEHYDKIINSVNIDSSCTKCEREILDYNFYLEGKLAPFKCSSEVLNVKVIKYLIKFWKLFWFRPIDFYTRDLSDHYPVLSKFEFLT